MSKQSSQRLPAPSLFVGPPSHNASNASLARANTDTSQSSRNIPSSAIPGPASPSVQANLSRSNTGLSRQNTNLSRQNTRDALKSRRQRPRRGTAVLDAHWAALQSTLSDIELSAGSSAHVFGTGHAEALEELRAAQVELARAWGQTDAEDASTSPSSPTKTKETQQQQQQQQNTHKEQEKAAEQNERKLSTATTLDLTA
ncbi:unnamed protein product [Aureobasidium vineae]|uniref:Uncharacterized protein n=1 Tax=Aureobasidium vineae TaxID=2773715 RepID=A0A9N8JKT0_9PEZI|nr:unnamed protein product [Aureobasidium vineae]